MGKMPKTLSTPLFAYTRKENAKYAKTAGKKLFGSYSAYIDALISRDRGIEPVLGSWKAPGEAKLDRKKKVATVEKASREHLFEHDAEVAPNDYEVYE